MNPFKRSLNPQLNPKRFTVYRAQLPLNYPTLGIFLTSILLFSFFIYHFCKRPEIRFNFDKNREEIIGNEQELIHAVNFWNESLNACKWPIIDPNQKEILPFVNYFRSIDCRSEMPPLASLLSEGHLLISSHPFNQSSIPPLRCTIAELSGSLAPEITEYRLGKEIEIPLNKPTFVEMNQFLVRCYNQTIRSIVDGSLDNRILYEKNFVNFVDLFDQIPLPSNPPSNHPFVQADPMNPSLMILVLDSTSLNQFRRHAPESFSFMKENDFISMNMYNKIGDNSAVNLLPILAGRPIQNDPKNLDPEDEFVDLEKVTFLWDLMKIRGCVTMINDEIADVRRGLFHYPNHTFQGFPRSPSDFYLRPTHLFNTRHRLSSPANACLNDGTMSSVEYLSYMREFSISFRDVCHFSFNFLTSLTHDDPSMLGTIDRELRRALESLFANHLHKTTTFVIMGDHGNRIHQIQRTTTGRIEERSPLFSIRLPNEWKDKNSRLHKNLRTNANRLVDNFDLHQTLRHVALSGMKDLLPPARGIDLFSSILSPSRTCLDTNIPPNFCLCMDHLEKKSNRLTNESDTYERLFSLLSEKVMTLPCVRQTRPHFGYPNLEVFSLNQMVLHGLTNINQWDSMSNYTVSSDFEWIEIGMIADMNRRQDGVQLSFGIVARYRHQLSTDLFELSESPRIVEKTLMCNAPSIDQIQRVENNFIYNTDFVEPQIFQKSTVFSKICEMCFYDNLVIARNEAQIT